jgi:hypothetical protein
MKASKVMLQPFKGLAKADLPDVHHQIDGATAADRSTPVHELGPTDGQDSPHRVPLGSVVRIGGSLQCCQDRGQRQRA